MAPDDPRHGTPAGSHGGCKADCCREARNRYERNSRKRREAGYPSPLVDATGTHRRLMALMALGWPGQAISEHAGINRGQSAIASILARQTVHQTTRNRVARAYDELSMCVGPSAITRARARAKGWLPPLAWDDERIDDPTYRPRLRDVRVDYDEVVVQRLMAGERLPSTTAEKAEVVRRWRKSGQSLGELERRTGINPARRYGEAS